MTTHFNGFNPNRKGLPEGVKGPQHCNGPKGPPPATTNDTESVTVNVNGESVQIEASAIDLMGVQGKARLQRSNDFSGCPAGLQKHIAGMLKSDPTMKARMDACIQDFTRNYNASDDPGTSLAFQTSFKIGRAKRYAHAHPETVASVKASVDNVGPTLEQVLAADGLA